VYLVIALLAALVTVWLAFQILGTLFKLLFLLAAIWVAVAAFRRWRETTR